MQGSEASRVVTYKDWLPIKWVLEVGGPSRPDLKNIDPLNAGIRHPKGQELNPKI